MKRRLNLAAGLLHDPDILLLDEPTVGVDPQSRNAIFDNLELLKRRGKALLYTTHYMEEAERLADRIVVIDHGRVIADDTLAGLQSRVAGGGRRHGDARVGVPHADGKEPARLMALTPLLAMVRKDLQLFFSDRRAVIVSFVVPIAIASFFGSIFSRPEPATASRRGSPSRSSTRTAAPISKAIVAGAQGDRNLKVTTPTADEARDVGPARQDQRRRRSSRRASATRPGARSSATARSRRCDVLYDPSRSIGAGDGARHPDAARDGGGQQGDVRRRAGPGARRADAAADSERRAMPDDQKRALLVRCCGSVQQFYNQQPAGGGQARRRRRGITMPYTVHEEAMTAGSNVAYNGYAHSFAGMGIQFLLFAMANLGIEMLLERQRGLWKRLRSAPVSRLTLLARQGGQRRDHLADDPAACRSRFAMIVFGVRIHGSVAGFLGVAVACALMASTFGLLIAALGKTPATARGVTTLAVLMMVMLGGAWVPTFIFPGVAAAGHGRRADPLGGGRPRRDDLARHRARAARIAADRWCCSASRRVRARRRAAIPLGRSLGIELGAACRSRRAAELRVGR